MCANLALIMARPGLQLYYDEPDIHEIMIEGDLAVVRLIWTLTTQAAAETQATTEEGIDVFRRQADGRWSIARFMAFSTAPNALLK